jgi:hypothetical protein
MILGETTGSMGMDSHTLTWSRPSPQHADTSDVYWGSYHACSFKVGEGAFLEVLTQFGLGLA